MIPTWPFQSIRVQHAVSRWEKWKAATFHLCPETYTTYTYDQHIWSMSSQRWRSSSSLIWCCAVSKRTPWAEQSHQLSLSLPVGGGGSPPQFVPSSSRGVAGRLWRCLLTRYPSWRDHGPDIGTPDVRPSCRRRGSADRWPSPGARYGEGKLLPVRTCATVTHWSLGRSRCQRWDPCGYTTSIRAQLSQHKAWLSCSAENYELSDWVVWTNRCSVCTARVLMAATVSGWSASRRGCWTATTSVTSASTHASYRDAARRH